MLKFIKAMAGGEKSRFVYQLNDYMNQIPQFRRFRYNVPPMIIDAAYAHAYEQCRSEYSKQHDAASYDRVFQRAVVEATNFCMQAVNMDMDDPS
jgi:hypothetical protein